MAMENFIGRATEKEWDWDAFALESNYPELVRAQMRFVGGGGSHKVDPDSLTPESFTLSLLHCPVQRYAPAHTHEVVEHFLVLDRIRKSQFLPRADGLEHCGSPFQLPHRASHLRIYIKTQPGLRHPESLRPGAVPRIIEGSRLNSPYLNGCYDTKVFNAAGIQQ